MQQARPMNPMQQMPVQPQMTPATSMGMGAGPNPYQQALSQGKQLAMPLGMGAQQGPFSGDFAAQQKATPQGSMGLMGAPQQGAPLSASAGFGAPATQSQAVNNAMRGTPMKKGGAVKKMASGGTTSSASKRADGIAQKGKTKGRMC